jgi:hypothetical protein
MIWLLTPWAGVAQNQELAVVLLHATYYIARPRWM